MELGLHIPNRLYFLKIQYDNAHLAILFSSSVEFGEYQGFVTLYQKLFSEQGGYKITKRGKGVAWGGVGTPLNLRELTFSCGLPCLTAKSNNSILWNVPLNLKLLLAFLMPPHPKISHCVLVKRSSTSHYCDTFICMNALLQIPLFPSLSKYKSKCLYKRFPNKEKGWYINGTELRVIWTNANQDDSCFHHLTMLTYPNPSL